MPVVGGSRVSSFGSSHYIPPPQMRGLLALNPKLAGYVAYDAGLRFCLSSTFLGIKFKSRWAPSNKFIVFLVFAAISLVMGRRAPA